MTKICGGVTGAWMKVTELDTTDNINQCPSTLTQHIDSNKRTCAINFNSASCAPVIYSIDAIKYSKVCGKIKAYQVGSPSEFYNRVSIDSYYVEGISLLVSLMEVHDGLLLLLVMKLVLTFLVTVPVLTLIKQEVPQLLQYSWGTITSVIQPVKAFFEMVSPMVVILCGMEPAVDL